ncbi:hypothetical protein M0804_003889 [Polistes exclamans]|nr:hypothetical protein M0804_003889 [Polistes exclamans]
MAANNATQQLGPNARNRFVRWRMTTTTTMTMTMTMTMTITMTTTTTSVVPETSFGTRVVDLGVVYTTAAAAAAVPPPPDLVSVRAREQCY